MALSTINRFITLFDDAFRALAVSVPIAETERLSILVHQAMQSKTRAYHTSDHVFGMCEGMNPRQVLAALFHDLVYYQLDVGIPLQCRPVLDGVTRIEGDALVLQPLVADDLSLSLSVQMFGFESGQVLPLYCGMNEFLSAVVAARLLQPYLNTDDLIAVIACIEATIPFRRPDSNGRTAHERLALRVEKVYRSHYPMVSAQDVEQYVEQVVWDAVKISNRDVGSFAANDPGLFLSSTWLLIEESNAPLKSAGIYTLREYRHALGRMDGFLRGLDPSSVFEQFRGYPSDFDMADLHTLATRNIRFACDFLGAKITSTSIIEAMALCTGTDGPISMFLGDIRSDDGRPDRVEDFLPDPPNSAALNSELLRVFEKGRTLESSNDLTTSPITAFVYRYMGDRGIDAALEKARDMFDSAITPLAYLQTLNRNMVCDIIRASASIAPSRRDALRVLEQQL